MNALTDHPPVALITGAARRVGATIARRLHAEGYQVIVHYGRSSTEAEALVDTLNQQRDDSAQALQADVRDTTALQQLASAAQARWGRLDLLVNNASSFYPTPLGELTESGFDDLIGTNLKAPLFLTQAAAPALRASGGCVINIVDIHAQRPKRGFTAYCAAKAGLDMITRGLAVELAPAIRVNGIAPGAILPPPDFDGPPEDGEQAAAAPVPLGRTGQAEEIAGLVLWLAGPAAAYVTGQIIAVDGGKSQA